MRITIVEPLIRRIQGSSVSRKCKKRFKNVQLNIHGQSLSMESNIFSTTNKCYSNHLCFNSCLFNIFIIRFHYIWVILQYLYFFFRYIFSTTNKCYCNHLCFNLSIFSIFIIMFLYKYMVILQYSFYWYVTHSTINW